jgi:MFS family permease
MQPSVWTVMALLLAVHLAGMGTFLAVPVLAPQIAAETGLPGGLAGLHAALAYAGALASGPLTQGLVTRWGGLRTLQVALLVVGVGIALAALGHPAALAASALLAGCGHGPVTPAGSHLLHGRAPPARQALIFSLKQTGVPAGAMLVAAAAPAIAVAAGWRWGILAVAAFCWVVALAVQPWRAALDADRRPGAPIGWRGATESLGLLRTSRDLRLLTLAGAGFGIGQFCFLSFFVVQQVEALDIDPVQAGLNLAVGQAAAIAARVLWGVVADRLGVRPVVVALGLTIAASSLALALAGPSWPSALVVLAGMAMGATAIGWNGVVLAEAARVAPQGRAGGATAALGFVFALAMIVAPSLFSVLVLTTGAYTAGFLLCVAGGLAGAWAAWGLSRARDAT